MAINLRNIAFWMLDFLTGNKVKKNYNEINRIISNGESNDKQLKNILKYAKDNTSFYAKGNYEELKDFPVVNKSVLKREYNNIIVERLDDKKIHWTCTSGSTGTPLKIPQNEEKRNRTKADLIFFNKKIGWELGDRYIFIRSWVNLYKMSKLRIYAQNFILVDTNKFDNAAMEELRNLLKKDKKIKCILGYASALKNFVNFLEKKGDNSSMFNIKVIVTASDELTAETKVKLKKMFKCKVVNRISNEEHGLLAMNFDGDDFFTLNTASYYFELLKIDSDEPAKLGEIGRLVITDLYNKKFPLIRYDIGDLAVGMSYDNNGSINKLKSFEGRGSEIMINSNGIPITCVSLSTHLCSIPGIIKYQLNVFKNRKVLYIVVDNTIFNSDMLEQNLVNVFGINDKVEYQIVENISIEKNGKYKPIKFHEEELV